jgi:hypothetical protein
MKTVVVGLILAFLLFTPQGNLLGEVAVVFTADSLGLLYHPPSAPKGYFSAEQYRARQKACATDECLAHVGDWPPYHAPTPNDPRPYADRLAEQLLH